MELNEIQNNIRTIAVIDPLTTKRIQCAGPHFVKYLLQLRHGYDAGKLSASTSSEKISETQTNFEIDVDYLRSLDPKEWKDQDHYHVLGLRELRYYATEDDIRRAYRKIVLKHHPDKRKALGEEISQEDDYFTCITKAYETLGNPMKRRAYDSIDPEFDDAIPTTSEIEDCFYEMMRKHFQLNARWSDRKNVPEFGDESSTRDQVDHFYNFWYDFESWREYSYLDEEDKEKGQDREERRWIEKQNKTIRLKRKKEEMARIRSLVDLAYNNDPRIVKFKNEEKERKLAAKRAKMTAAKAQKAHEEQILKEAQLAKDRADQAEQKRIEQIRLEKEQQRRALKKERKVLRDLAKEQNFYSTNEKEKLRNMEGLEKICEQLKLLELQEFNKNLQSGGRDVFLNCLKTTEDKLEEEKRAMNSAPPPPSPSTPQNGKNSLSAVRSVDKNAIWIPENMQILIKAVNLFPAGTVQRWEVIANYLNQHGTMVNDRKFQARDVLNKTKDLQSSDFHQNPLRSQANNNAFVSFEKNKKDLKIIDNAEISVNTDIPTDQLKTPPIQKSKQNGIQSKDDGQPPIQQNGQSDVTAKTWTKEEQALLEQAIKTYPLTTIDRWDRIAECIPNRTKKECLRRVRELVDRVNAKREAQQIVK